MIAALILAAGESLRMGRPKALLKIGEETFAGCIAKKCRESGVQIIRCVVGAHQKEIAAELRGEEGLQFLLNSNYKQGQISSLQEGLKDLPTGTSHALIWPVDQPLVQLNTVRALIQEAENREMHLTIPSFSGRRGHPVIYDIAAIETLLAFNSNQTAKQLMTIYSDSTALVEVTDEGTVLDIDTPEDYERKINSAAR